MLPRVTLVHLRQDVVDRIDHEREKIVDHTEEEGPLPQRHIEHHEELGRSEGAHEGIDPHRHDEENDGHRTAVVFLVGENPGRRVTDQHAQQRRLDGDFQRDGEGLQGIGIMEKLPETLEREASVRILKRVHRHQHQRQRDEKDQENRVRKAPVAPFGNQPTHGRE